MSAEDEETFQYLMYEFHYKYFKKSLGLIYYLQTQTI